MTKVPGSVGLPILGDKSIDFYRDPIRFTLKHIENTNSRVFCARFLNTPTVFVGCNSTLKELLTDGVRHTDMGYKAFMEHIFGQNILFTDGDMAAGLRQSLSQLFTPETVKTYQQRVERIVNECLHEVESSEYICLYTFMKRICTQICLSLFLDLDFHQASDTANSIVALTTTHWHGIISVPLSIKLPGSGGSTYRKALDAKEELLKIIIHKKEQNDSAGSFSHKVQQCPHGNEDIFVNNHLLLFTSALVPKALSSILTSFFIEISGDHRDLQSSVLEDSILMESLLLEAQRMYPPFLGGRRLATEDFNLNGYKVHKGHALVYLTYAAHRDPAVFDNPEQFDPHRWTGRNSQDKDKIHCFGGGPRGCIGQNLVWQIIQTVIVGLLTKYSVTLKEGQDLTHKWLPVSRPKNEILVKFVRKTEQQIDTDGS
ncbi:hypothetical protein FSP39_016949 [Pinctada imbricata]|uniref:Cytochrome P450 n=1 Tax=Pinctada imbricata TaxID=66713 RepID=A0AA88XZR9_PINIB|nr:hypothetical protein FSP39_016949 [Pinctada imbricata]